MSTRDALEIMDAEVGAAAAGAAPACDLVGFLDKHARVRLRDGSYGDYSFTGRLPLRFAASLINKIIRNTKHAETVTIDGITYAPGALKGATVSICGGAQFGKTVLELNVCGWVTTIEFLNYGYYTSDLALLSTIIDTKFRPDVVDQIPWMSDMIAIGKGESRSGRAVNRKNAFQVSGPSGRHAFGYFNGMQKPPTTISLDVAVLDEVDDIPEKNIGFISGRMTNSDVQLTCFIGTQRIHAAGQNARYLAGTMHRWLVPCSRCGKQTNLEEAWPGVCRVAPNGAPASPKDEKLSETCTYDSKSSYYPACPDCGTELIRDEGHLEAEHPERAQSLNWSVRISQMACSAIPWRDLVASWFAALADPNPGALAAWHCDRRGIPHAGAEQPISPAILSRARACSLDAEPLQDGEEPPPQYDMTLGPLNTYSPRVAGFDTGPRCWLTVNEVVNPFVSALVWAEMIPSGAAFARLLELHQARAFGCIFLDAGGEPDLTKRVVLALNGLDTWTPPNMPANELRKATLSNIGAGLSWDGSKGIWRGIHAAAVAFSLRDAGGIQQDIGFTQDGHIYPLIKCNRAESIEGFVNSFLTPKEGVIQQIPSPDGGAARLRLLPRQRLPRAAIGPGVTDSLLDTHLENLRRVRNADGSQDWADGVENHLGLAGVYMRLAEVCLDTNARRKGNTRKVCPFSNKATTIRAGRRSNHFAMREAVTL